MQEVAVAPLTPADERAEALAPPPPEVRPPHRCAPPAGFSLPAPGGVIFVRRQVSSRTTEGPTPAGARGALSGDSTGLAAGSALRGGAGTCWSWR